MSDEQWRDLAEGTRTALHLLGYTIEPHCLPGETEACGGTYAEHAVAHLAALTAVINHHLVHLSPPSDMVSDIYHDVIRDIHIDCKAGE